MARAAEEKYVVLLSAGLDSTINLYEALQAGQVVEALTFDYGQRAAPREMDYAHQQCRKLKVPHRVLDLRWFADFTKTSLVNRESQVPVGVDIGSLQASEKSAAQVWVPNRNGIFLSVAAAYAESYGAKWIVPGFNREEAATFPDNTADFLSAFSKGLWYSTANHVEVKCFTTELDKKQIVARGRELGVDFDLIWPCYLGEAKPCGECESCLRFQRAIK